jgi:hypothetical protein
VPRLSQGGVLSRQLPIRAHHTRRRVRIAGGHAPLSHAFAGAEEEPAWWVFYGHTTLYGCLCGVVKRREGRVQALVRWQLPRVGGSVARYISRRDEPHTPFPRGRPSPETAFPRSRQCVSAVCIGGGCPLCRAECGSGFRAVSLCPGRVKDQPPNVIGLCNCGVPACVGYECGPPSTVESHMSPSFHPSPRRPALTHPD